MFEGFEVKRFQVSQEVTINYRVAGSGPALLLLHGHPQTHVMWHRVAPRLAEKYTVVVPDLRGYGDSSRPEPGEDCAAYSKRVMAQDMAALMQSLGHHQFFVGAHDRGARVAHRLALDHPQHVKRLLLLDIAPTLDMYEGTNQEFATAYWHWFLFIQPAPLPEMLLEVDPVTFIRRYMGRRHAGLSVFSPEAMSEYERCYALPGNAAAVCNDYRASAGIDLDHDRADRASNNHLSMPLKVLWGRHGAVGRCFDVLALWRRISVSDVSGHDVDCGHYIAEEEPDLVVKEMLEFFAP
ncbi:zinc-containing alcohol dehydrogenase superfamily protein [Pusillimonas sp. T7-7]|uniref:alpha/beta fold hydrolase n=1 Tax=Pusillimonas sp. (strain T7-7) TaxID=1007105 RepID=UPI00020856E2|nr:alpha/beta hydrolase [Pusillimonas sp. T7-7]AEC20855.1 zinc-containing alcohol dehydrogenase superfamily protein [Pusillimonas sp. T7-7]